MIDWRPPHEELDIPVLHIHGSEQAAHRVNLGQIIEPARFRSTAPVAVEETPVTMYTNRSEIEQRLLNDKCELCEAEGPVQMHHVRKLADLKGHDCPPSQVVGGLP